MKLPVAVRQLARDMADDLVPMIKKAAQRGSTTDMVRLDCALDAFREALVEAKPKDFVTEWRIARVYLEERPVRAADRRAMLDCMGFMCDNTYDGFVLVPRDHVVLDAESPAGVVAYLALRSGAYRAEPRSAKYLETSAGKKLHAGLKRLIEANVRKRKQPTVYPDFTITPDPMPQPKLRLVEG